ncbi:hypothetical protein, conserved [Plasmodium gonderi]|uniref:C3H1-type domain-containing protein n=1 Tax=Plasmodium gonderi TaxID=77519 RepID=A0A1Y1JI73_PLAGO|nr:hypothetical protein, conserved [Plasmodium gonderi]GAW81328.1 hypothetical protein, conserved [Plasmodium gonderi]
MECVSYDNRDSNNALYNNELINGNVEIHNTCANNNNNCKSIEINTYKNVFEKGFNCKQYGKSEIRTNNRKNEEKKGNHTKNCIDDDMIDNFKVGQTHLDSNQKIRKNVRSKNFPKNKGESNHLLYEDKYMNDHCMEKGKRLDNYYTNGNTGNKKFNDFRIKKGIVFDNGDNNNNSSYNKNENFGKNNPDSNINMLEVTEEKCVKNMINNNRNNIVTTSEKVNISTEINRNRRRYRYQEKQRFNFTNKREESGIYNDKNRKIECVSNDDNIVSQNFDINDGRLCGAVDDFNDGVHDIVNYNMNYNYLSHENNGSSRSVHNKKCSFVRKSKSLNRSNIYEKEENVSPFVSITNREILEEREDYTNVSKKTCSNNELKFKERKKDTSNSTSREANYDFKSALNVQFCKTKMCPYMNTKEKCKRFLNSMCPYAHDQSELKPFPDLYKTAMCRNFMKNLCNKTKIECNFAHNVEELRSTDEFYKTTLCKFFLNGYCKADANCRHAHGHKELKYRPLSNVSQENCKDSAEKEINIIEESNENNLEDNDEKTDAERRGNILNKDSMNKFKSSESCNMIEGKDIRTIRVEEIAEEGGMFEAEVIKGDDATAKENVDEEKGSILSMGNMKKNDNKKKKEKFYNISRKLMSVSTKDTCCFLSNVFSKNIGSSENCDDENESVRTNEDSTIAHSNGDSKIKSLDNGNKHFKGDMAHSDFPLKSDETMDQNEIKNEGVNNSCNVIVKESMNRSDTNKEPNSVENIKSVRNEHIGEDIESDKIDVKLERNNKNSSYSSTDKGRNLTLNENFVFKKENRKLFLDDNMYLHKNKLNNGVDKGSNEFIIHTKFDRKKISKGHANTNFPLLNYKDDTKNFKENITNEKFKSRANMGDSVDINNELCPKNSSHFPRLCNTSMCNYNEDMKHTENNTWEHKSHGCRVSNAYSQQIGENCNGEYNKISYKNKKFYNTNKSSFKDIKGSVSNNNFNGIHGNNVDNYYTSMNKNYGNSKRLNGANGVYGSGMYNNHNVSIDNSNNNVMNGDMMNNVVTRNDLRNNHGRNFTRNSVRNMKNNARNNNWRNNYISNYGIYNNEMNPNDVMDNNFDENNNLHTMNTENMNNYNNSFSCYNISDINVNKSIDMNNDHHKNVTQSSNCNVVYGETSMHGHNSYDSNYNNGNGNHIMINQSANHSGNYGGKNSNKNSGKNSDKNSGKNSGSNNNPCFLQDYAPSNPNNITKPNKNYRGKNKNMQHNMLYETSNNNNLDNNNGYDNNNNIYGLRTMQLNGNYNTNGFNLDGPVNKVINHNVDDNIYGDLYINNGTTNNHPGSISSNYNSDVFNNYSPYNYDVCSPHMMNVSMEKCGIMHSIGIEPSVRNNNMYNITSMNMFSEVHNGVLNDPQYDTLSSLDHNDKKVHDNVHGSRNKKCFMNSNVYNETSYKSSDENCRKAGNMKNLTQPFVCNYNMNDEMSVTKDNLLYREPKGGYPLKNFKNGQMIESEELKRNNYDDINLGTKKFDYICKNEKEYKEKDRGNKNNSSEIKGTTYCTNFKKKNSMKALEENHAFYDNGNRSRNDYNGTNGHSNSSNCRSSNRHTIRDRNESVKQSTLKTQLTSYVTPVNTLAGFSSCSDENLKEYVPLGKVKVQNYVSKNVFLKSANLKSGNAKNKFSHSKGSQSKISQNRGSQNKRTQNGEPQFRVEENEKEKKTKEKHQNEPGREGEIIDQQSNVLSRNKNIEKYLIGQEPKTCVSCYQYMTESTPEDIVSTEPYCLTCGHVIKKSLSLMIIELLRPQVEHLLSDANFYVQNYHD